MAVTPVNCQVRPVFFRQTFLPSSDQVQMSEGSKVPKREQVDRPRAPQTRAIYIYMKCTKTSYMDFVFISMCITRSYYACLVLLICNDHYSTEYIGGVTRCQKIVFFQRNNGIELNTFFLSPSLCVRLIPPRAVPLRVGRAVVCII